VELGGEPVAEDVVDPADISRGAFEALRRLEGEEPATLEDPFESLRRLEAEAEAEAAAGQPSAAADEPAITGRYGVASKEAFAVLGDADADDLTDWQAFAGAEAESPTLRRESPQRGTPYPAATPPAPGEEAFDEWAGTEPEPRKKRGIWPFRRRRDEVEEEAVVEEATEWTDDGMAPAPGWFADIDEDEVVPPTPDLPETEWPAEIESSASAETAPTVAAPAPVAPAEPIEMSSTPMEPTEAMPGPDQVAAGEQPPLDFEAGAAPLVVTPPSRLPDLEIVLPPLPEVPQFEDEFPPLDAADLGAVEPEEADAGTVELPVAPSPYLEDEGYETLPRSEPALEPEPFEEDLEDLRAGGPWRLDFDDGTTESPYGATAYDPAPAPAVRGDRDAWDEGPDWDPEATVEMTDPGLALSDDLYGGAGTIEHRGLAEEIHRLGAEDTEWQAMSAAMPGIETGVVGFEDVADLSTGEQYQEAPRSDLGARVGTGLLLLVFLLGTMFVGGAAMAVFIGAMAMLGIWEFYGTLRRLEFQPLTLPGYVGGIGLLAAAWFYGPVAIPVALSLLIVVTFFVYAFSPLRQDALANGGLTILAVAWVAGTVAFATPILRQEDFRILVMAVVATTVAMDVGAFWFGRTWGRRALAPMVSPNKSIEGLLGGILLTMGAGVAIGLFAEPFDLRTGIALGIVVSVMAPLGDLAESMVKRSLGVKDMGTILPGHGGVLDRIDGFLFVLPPAWLLYLVTGLLG
jgi:phosphatidate cytidylyltransferase